MEIRIYYEDTDCGGVVYYANYLRYFERARTELLRSAHIDLSDLAKKGISFVVSKAGIEYKYPARYNDVLWVETKIAEVKKASFLIRYQIFNSSDSRLLILGMTKMVSVNSRRKPFKLDEDITKKLRELQRVHVKE